MSETDPLRPDQVAAILAETPSLREDYTTYLLEVGWGEAANGRMIYEGPIDPSEVYGPGRVTATVVLLGDDFMGYCFAWHTIEQRYGEIDPRGNWEPWPASRGILDYVSGDETVS